VLDILEVSAQTPQLVEEARRLFMEYEAELDEDLCFQSFEQELAELPGKYAPPRGALLLGRFGVDIVGCVALRPLDGGVCEMKRLYIRPAFRRHGFGKELALEAVHRARLAGYSIMRLDTLARLIPALLLYRELGFAETSAYYHNPLPGVVYMSLDLVNVNAEAR